MISSVKRRIERIMKQILCFGDSNTHGYNFSGGGGRFDYQTRWTGRLAQALGDDWLILEAGLNGCNSGFPDPNPTRNGQEGIGWFLHAHKPLDGIVLMLGTNDTKDAYRADAVETTEKIHQLITIISTHEQTVENRTKILLVAPVPMDERICLSENRGEGITPCSVAISRQLGSHYRVLAENLGIWFADAGKWGVELAEDGCHYSPAGHCTFAEHIESILREMFAAR